MAHIGGRDKWERRTRSWSPHSFGDATTDIGLPSSGEEDFSDDPHVFYDARRGAASSADFFVGEKHWHEVETSSGQRIKIVGETGALKRLLTLPVRSAGEAICLHRIGDCLVVLNMVEDGADEWTVEDDIVEIEGLEAHRHRSPSRSRSPIGRGGAAFTRCLSPHSSRAGCHIRVEGDMVRVYPRAEMGEPAACRELKVQDGLPLVAVPPSRPAGPSLDVLDWMHPEGGAVVLKGRGYSESMREMSGQLVDALLKRCDRDGGLCLIVPGPSGPRLASRRVVEEEPDEEFPGEAARCQEGSWALVPMGAEVKDGSGCKGEQVRRPANIVRRGLVMQALLCYGAGVQLAQQCQPWAATGAYRSIPCGSRASTKACQQPARVRKLMFRAVRSLRAAAATLGSDDAEERRQWTSARLSVLLASACEFLADTYLAEGAGPAPPISRHESALYHLVLGCEHLSRRRAVAESCAEAAEVARDEFRQSMKRLEQRVMMKRITVHLALARLRHEVLWSPGEHPCIAPALRELDSADALVRGRPEEAPRSLSPPAPKLREEYEIGKLGLPMVLPKLRAMSLAETNTMAAIAKSKADLFYKLATLALRRALDQQQSGRDGRGRASEPSIGLFLDAQQREMQETPQPLDEQCIRWLCSTISTSMRHLRHLSELPSDMVRGLQAQARSLMAHAYGDLGYVFASNGRYTKAMSYVRQGINLAGGEKDALPAAQLQLRLGRLQLRLYIPGAGEGGDFQQEPCLMRGLCAATPLDEGGCSQVVSELQSAVRRLEANMGSTDEDSDEDAEQASSLREEAEATCRRCRSLMGRVQMRQGLTRLVRMAHFHSVGRLCKEDTALQAALEMLQDFKSEGGSAAPGGKAGDEGGADAPLTGMTKDAIELVLQAGENLKQAGDYRMAATAHACLAAVYLCVCKQDSRVQRLSRTHCHRALELLAMVKAPPDGADSTAELELAVKLFEAKALRRSSSKGGPAWIPDVRAAEAACGVALDVVLSKESPCCGRSLLGYLRQEAGGLLQRVVRAQSDADCKALKAAYLELLSARSGAASQAAAWSGLRGCLRDVRDASLGASSPRPSRR